MCYFFTLKDIPVITFFSNFLSPSRVTFYCFITSMHTTDKPEVMSTKQFVTCPTNHSCTGIPCIVELDWGDCICSGVCLWLENIEESGTENAEWGKLPFGNTGTFVLYTVISKQYFRSKKLGTLVYKVFHLYQRKDLWKIKGEQRSIKHCKMKN